MDTVDLQSSLPFIIIIVVLLVLSIVMRRRRSEKGPVDIASSLYMDIRQNQTTLASVGSRGKLRKLKMDSWQRNENKLEFLSDSVRRELSNTFHLVEDYNRQVESVKGYQQAGYMSIVNVDKMRRSLESSQKGLEDWLRENTGQQGQQTSQRQGCLFG